MKIAIDGTHSTGKTTIFKILESDEKYSSFKFLPEMGSVVAKNNFAINSPLDWKELFNNKIKYESFIGLLTINQNNEESSCENIFIDSSLYRVYAYAIENELTIPENIIAEINYDIIFYCPIEFDFINDNFRFDFSRAAVDKKLVELIKKHHQGKLIILNGSIDNRISIIKQYT